MTEYDAIKIIDPTTSPDTLLKMSIMAKPEERNEYMTKLFNKARNVMVSMVAKWLPIEPILIYIDDEPAYECGMCHQLVGAADVSDLGLEFGYKYCPNCGHRVKWESVTKEEQDRTGEHNHED